MASWGEIERAEPDFAASARELLEAHVHKTLATLRRDGAPRISGTEAKFAEGDLWFGSMWEARKAVDLRRDPRFALHSGSDDPPAWRGDAKLSGIVEEILDLALIARLNDPAPPGPSHLFRAQIAEMSIVRLGEPADHLVIEIWTEERGLRSMRRS
jgi:hypothetical protein